ncbi:MAG: deoxyribodipyrimidine photo-lyase [Neisseria sp.]|uniref:cryptochrome/photolyase family protein n=1 Tax=Neisseria sp. TaxID=192066 RepID=UPI0026DDC326|nr:deoxyribodipyrimidine photo-lyase [Neisseria sp.]MDO4641392.1 deoxyribodipyrimidine photo-lyase [Neisseria sp.]
MPQTTLVWFRRDLRASNHLALQEAVGLGLPVIAVFLFEDGMVADDSAGNARRLTFIHQCLSELHAELAAKGVPLFILRGAAENEIPAFAAKINAACVVCTEEDEPKSLLRDGIVAAKLIENGRHFRAFNDWLLLPKSVLVEATGQPYTDFTAYQKAWLAVAGQAGVAYRNDWPALRQIQQSLSENWQRAPSVLSLAQLGVQAQPLVLQGGEKAGNRLLMDFLSHIDTYHLNRDFPALQHASQLSVYLRFGVLSVHKVVDSVNRLSGNGATAWLGALAKREFYHQLLYHHAGILKESFNSRFHNMAWPGGSAYLAAWQCGKTGYPLVDAAMRRLNQTGFLPASLRRFAAEFLTQVLLCDWRQGEIYFAQQLLDFDLAVNNGNWQDAAGVGTQTGKPLRIINPLVESQRLDPDGMIVRRYIPELARLPKDVIHSPWLVKNTIQTNGYPDPIVNYAVQKQQALALLG